MERAFRLDLLTPISSWKWSQFYQPNDFVWREGVTPFSSLQIVSISMISYLLMVGVLLLIMKSQKPMSIKLVASSHYLFLSIWSLIMFLGMAYETGLLYFSGGLNKLYCESRTEASGSAYYWMYIYYFSKFVELFDTVIIILRKKDLIFLHVYHHCIVMLLAWLWLDQKLIFCALGVCFNTFVHIIMYYFYHVSVLGKRVWWKKYITAIQIIQFISSFILALPYVYYHNQLGDSKCSGWNGFLFSVFCNASFLVLFIQFYFKTYTKKEE